MYDIIEWVLGTTWCHLNIYVVSFLCVTCFGVYLCLELMHNWCHPNIYAVSFLCVACFGVYLCLELMHELLKYHSVVTHKGTIGHAPRPFHIRVGECNLAQLCEEA